MSLDDGRGCRGIVDPMRYREATRPAVERGERIGAVAQHRHAKGLEMLDRLAQVEERLRTGANRRDRIPGNSAEIGADVAGHRIASVHTADSTGGEYGHTGGRGQGDRRRHGRRAHRPTLGDGDAEIAFGCFGGRAEHSLEFSFGQTNPRHAVDDRGEGGNCSGRPDGSDAALKGFMIRRRWQAKVRKDRRLEGDNASPVGLGLLNLFGDNHG